MTDLDLAEVARQQNDADHAAGKLPGRHCEDEVILRQVAMALAADQQGGDGRGEAA